MGKAEDYSYREVYKTFKRVGIYNTLQESEHKFLHEKAYHIASKVPNPKMYEYGTLAGASAICVGMGIQYAKELAKLRGTVLDVKLISVDNYAAFKKGKNPRFPYPDRVREDVIKCGVETSVEIVEMDDLEHIVTLGNRSVNFAFVDSLHSYEHVTKTLDLMLPKMAKDGFLCGHDYILKSLGVIYAVEDFKRKYHQNICGFGVEYSTWWCVVRTPVEN